MRLRGNGLVHALIARGLVPINCREANVHIAADGALTLEYTVFITEVDLAKLGDAMLAAAEEATRPQQFKQQTEGTWPADEDK